MDEHLKEAIKENIIESEEPVEKTLRWFSITKEVVIAVCFIVSCTSLYFTMQGKIDALDVNLKNHEEKIKRIEDTIAANNTAMGQKLDTIKQQQSDQLILITKIATQLEYYKLK